MSEDFLYLDSKIAKIINENEQLIDIEYLLNSMDALELNSSEQLILLKKVYSYNLALTRNLSNKIDEIQKITDNECLDLDDINLTEQVIDNKTNFIDYKKNNNHEIKKYVNLIETFSDAMDFEMLNDLIEDDFVNKLNYLIAYYVLELVTLKKIQYEEKNFFQDEQSNIQTIIDNLKHLRDSHQEDNPKITNKLIYVQTDSGNIPFINSLNKISSEYYKTIESALNSISDGTFKCNKRIGKSDDGFYSPLLQVRNNDIRIFYLKISANVYLIIDVIVKKVDTSKLYSSFVRKISKDAYKEREKFLNMSEIEKNNFINDNMKVTDEINSIINQKKKVL